MDVTEEQLREIRDAARNIEENCYGCESGSEFSMSCHFCGKRRERGHGAGCPVLTLGKVVAAMQSVRPLAGMVRLERFKIMCKDRSRIGTFRSPIDGYEYDLRVDTVVSMRSVPTHKGVSLRWHYDSQTGYFTTDPAGLEVEMSVELCRRPQTE